MSRPDIALPEILSFAPCPPGWFARYTHDDPDNPLIEPVAAWGLLVESDDGERVCSVVALVPDGGELVPARDAENFEEVFFGGSPCAPPQDASQQVEQIQSIISVMDGWIERAKAEPAIFLTPRDLSAHQVHLRQLADLLQQRA